MSARAEVTAHENIGRYRIINKLGKGASGSVYRAYDAFRNGDVAIKIFDSRAFTGPDNELARTGFFTEAALLGKLDHPHVVRVYDASNGPEDYFVVSEFVAGGSLADFCVPGKLTDLETALDIVYKLASALRYLHANGIIHRDIKPENILLGDGTNVKIADFGAAVVDGFSASQNVMLGSPYYMSPQRLEGEPADLQSDIYSVGVLLYELLTGRRPFLGNSLQSLLYQMHFVPPPPPSSLRTDLPIAIDAIVERALASETDARYSDWDQFASDLSSLAFRSDGGRVRREALATASGRYEVLRGMPFFAEFSEIELWEIVGISEFRRTVEGDVVMREGEAGNDFFLLIEGSARISKAGKTIDVAQPHSTLGEIAYILKGSVPRNASVFALDSGLTLRIANEDVALLSVACRSKIEQRFLEILAHRLIDVNRRLSHV